MTRKRRVNKICILFIAAGLMLSLMSGCNTVDDERIPNVPVVLNLSTPDLWNTYGVSGYGNYRQFIRTLGQPRDFAYTANAATGYGGVLLVSGVDPFTLEAGVPLAYDLACPVEVKPDIRVSVQTDGSVPIAVCPDCGSRYDIVERGGAPTDGEALRHKYGLKRYDCLQSSYGGYMITNRF